MTLTPDCKLHMASPLSDWRAYFKGLEHTALADVSAKIERARRDCGSAELNWINQLAVLVDAEKARRFNDLLMELQDAKVNAAYQRRELEKAKTMARIETLECFAAKL